MVRSATRCSCPVLLAIALVVATGCNREPPGTRVAQRSSVELTGLAKPCRLRIGDISLHDVEYAEITILGPKDEFLVRQRTVREGESVGFRLEGEVYQFEVLDIEYHMTSEDFLTFRVAKGGEIHEEPGEVRLRELASAEVPDLEGRVHVEIGDIQTDEEEPAFTTLTILETQGAKVILRETVRQGDRLKFAFEGRAFHVDVVEFESHVTNEDYARLVIRPDAVGE